MKIGDRTLGEEYPPYVIAELGVNHDGSPERLMELVRLAAGAGVDAVKFQYFEAERLMSRASRLAKYQQESGERDPVEMLRRLETPIDVLAAAGSFAHSLGLDAIVTVFSVELFESARRFRWDAYKTASPDIINRPLLHAATGTGRPLIVSTGASTMDEVERASAWLTPAAGRSVFLQCVSAYPTPPGQTGIEGFVALRERFAGRPTGYSDHTPDVETGARMVRLGACVLEKHLTHSNLAPGPDHAASLEPGAMRRYVTLAHAAWEHVSASGVEEWQGERSKRVLECERDVRLVSRQSIVTARGVARGARVTRDMLTIKRPGTGLEPWMLELVVGRVAIRDLAPDHPIHEADLAPIESLKASA